MQWVGFRWYIQSRAQALGVPGWASNRPEGSVEVVGVASPATLEAFEKLVRAGPPGALVTRVATDDVPHDAVDTKSFVIKG